MTDTPSPSGHLLCIGIGYTAGYTARRLVPAGWQVTGTTRSSEKAAALEEDGITPLLWQAGEPLSAAGLASITDLLVSAAPHDGTCPVHDALQSARCHMPKLRSVIYYSSTGVYGDHGGNWVDEETPPTSALERGRNRLVAEQAWQAFGEAHGLPVIILRLSGIYGPGRNALETLRRQGPDARRVHKPGHVFNRIHVADIAAITGEVLHRIAAGSPPPHRLYNLADDAPSPPEEVTGFAAGLLGWPPPPLIPFNEAGLSPMGRSFYAENKKIRNTRVKEDLGMSLKFPSYREGLTALHTA